MFQLLVIGDVTIDTHLFIDNAAVECDLNHINCRLCLDYAAKVPITNSLQSVGGNGANVAVGATRLGIQTAILSSIGKDDSGKTVRAVLKKQKVNADLISLDKTTPTRYSTILNFQGERTILSHHATRQYVWPKKVPPTDWIYLTSLSAGWEELIKPLKKHLEKHPTVRLAFNPGSFQLKYSLPQVKELVALSDLLIVNLEEAEIILNTKITKEKTPAALIHELLALGVKEVTLTDAARGAYAGDMENVLFTPSYPVKVVAKTGAGDAFSSGYLAAKIYGHDVSTALQWGIADSCAVIQKIGAEAGLASKNELQSIVEQFPQIKPTEIA